MRLDTFMAPLRASRAALVPYIENFQDSASSTVHELGAKAHDLGARAQDLVQHPPKAARWLGNRYVLITLAAGACFFAARRLQRWRRQHARNTPRKRAGSTARHAAAPRKTSSANRAGRVH